MQLVRFTTEYKPEEDRFRLLGLTRQDQSISLWLTQRILKRLIDALLRVCDQEQFDTPAAADSPRMKSRSDAPPAPITAGEDTATLLTTEIRVSKKKAGVVLQFESEGDEAVQLPLKQRQLQQWLRIIHAIWLQAGWPGDIWPQWFTEKAMAAEPSDMTIH